VNRWKDEGELWEFMATRLRGWWRRLEATYPEGLPDAFGLFDQRTHWLELKVGRPSRDAFEPKQIEFALECIKRNASWHVAFGYRDEVLLFKDLALVAPVKPKFWVTPAERLHRIVDPMEQPEP